MTQTASFKWIHDLIRSKQFTIFSSWTIHHPWPNHDCLDNCLIFWQTWFMFLLSRTMPWISAISKSASSRFSRVSLQFKSYKLHFQLMILQFVVDESRLTEFLVYCTFLHLKCCGLVSAYKVAGALSSRLQQRLTACIFLATKPQVILSWLPVWLR